ncbi:MAG: hypothetical protein HY927_00020 [Elusimicrobia bacterium]|nr:hypothetical protein [Elusimicrobiota bacterium]
MSSLPRRVGLLLSLAACLAVAVHRAHHDFFGPADTDGHCCLCHGAAIFAAPSIEPPAPPVRSVLLKASVPDVAPGLAAASPETTRGPPSA